MERIERENEGNDTVRVMSVLRERFEVESALRELSKEYTVVHWTYVRVHVKEPSLMPHFPRNAPHPLVAGR